MRSGGVGDPGVLAFRCLLAAEHGSRLALGTVALCYSLGAPLRSDAPKAVFAPAIRVVPLLFAAGRFFYDGSQNARPIF